MPRTDDDSWDITESVGATALGVAAARAAETDSADPLIHDPFARVFLEAAGEGMWNMFDGSALPAELVDVDPDLPARMQTLIDFFIVRTAFIDDFFRAAAAAGVRQVVILAAGLDARAWRLDWPTDTRVYEIDQPKVLDFKSATLRDHGAKPRSHRMEVPVDLRQDWPTALQQNGFDPSVPTAWSAEGLLRYLPARAQDLLFERIQALSSVGSWMVTNAPSDDALDPEYVAREQDLAQQLQAAATRLGQTRKFDMHDLSYPEKRTDAGEWLRDHGWEVSAVAAAELMTRYRRNVPHARPDSTIPNLLVSARRVS